MVIAFIIQFPDGTFYGDRGGEPVEDCGDAVKWIADDEEEAENVKDELIWVVNYRDYISGGSKILRLPEEVVVFTKKYKGDSI